MDKLPIEIISYIMKYLSFRDRLNVRLVNTTFYNASLHPMLIRNEHFAINQRSNNNGILSSFINKNTLRKLKKILLKSIRKSISLNISGKTLMDDINIFEDLGPKIVWLRIVYSNCLTNSFLDFITQYCCNLEVLELNRIRNCLFTDKPRKKLLKLYCITFNGVRLSDWNFNIIMKCVPNVKDVGINNCEVLEWTKDIEIFYSEFGNNTFTDYTSKAIFTRAGILKSLNTTNQIKVLRLSKSCSIFLQLSPQIKLNTLILDGTQSKYFSDELSLDMNLFNLMLNEQTTLQKLKIIAFPCYILLAVSQLHNLKYLNFYYANKLDYNSKPETCLNIFVESLNRMKDIKELHISPLNQYELQLPLTIPDSTLKSLTTLKCLIDDGDKIVELGKNLLNLKIINGSILTVNNYHSLFKNLIKLRYLSITNCTELKNNIIMDLPISNLHGLVCLSLSGAEISYRFLEDMKFLYLKSLYIDEITLEFTNNKNGLGPFENTLKIFSSLVPALTRLEMHIPANEKTVIETLQFESFCYRLKPDNLSDLKQRLPNFQNLKYFVFD